MDAHDIERRIREIRTLWPNVSAAKILAEVPRRREQYLGRGDGAEEWLWTLYDAACRGEAMPKDLEP